MAAYCQYCGSPLKAGMAYCESCGQPVPGQQPGPQPGYMPPPQPPVIPQPLQNYPPPQSPPAYYPSQGPYYPPPPSQPASSGGCWRNALIIVVVLVILSICCSVVGVIAMLASGASIMNQINLLSPSSIIPQTTLEAMIPTNIGNMVETAAPNLTLEPSTILTAVPNLTLEPSTILTSVATNPMDPSTLLTALPGGQATPAAPPGNATGGGSVLLDNTSNLLFPNTNQYHVDLSQQGVWKIEVKQPGLSVAVLPPGQVDSSATGVSIKLKLTTTAPGQVAGVRCMLQDKDNYYQVAIKDKSFAIGKVVDGQFTALTSPEWKPSQFIGSKGLSGGADIEVVCNQYGVGLWINTLGEIQMVADPDNSFSSGQVAIYAGPGDQQANGFYASATFGQFKVVTIN